MPDTLLTHEFFTPLIDASFAVTIAAGDSPVMLTLEAVTPLPPPRRRSGSAVAPVTDGPARQEPFSLQFRGPLDRFLPQASYRMAVETAPTPLDIFIVPVGREPTGFVYEAVFG